MNSPAHLQQLEREVMAYRYAYYVECDPLIPDRTYDLLEQAARQVLPASSPVHKVGSDLASDYSADVVDLAQRIRTGEYAPELPWGGSQ